MQVLLRKMRKEMSEANIGCQDAARIIAKRFNLSAVGMDRLIGAYLASDWGHTTTRTINHEI